jgi:hypothetical protein
LAPLELPELWQVDPAHLALSTVFTSVKLTLVAVLVGAGVLVSSSLSSDPHDETNANAPAIRRPEPNTATLILAMTSLSVGRAFGVSFH